VEEQRHPRVRWSPWHDRLHRRLQQQPDLLPEQRPLLLAVSGGQDSMALLALLNDLVRLHHWPLQAWHGDHGWHPRSARIAEELQQWCGDQAIPLQIERAPSDLAANEASARHWRYDRLGIAAKQQQADVVTGHTGSDRSETVVLQLARGTDLAGLSALRPVRPLHATEPEGAQLRRPLLGFSRAETAQICQDLAIPTWEDPSNQSLAFARNRIRAEVMPVLEQLHPGSSRRIADLAERVSQVQDSQQELSRLALEALTTPTGLDRRRIGRLLPSTRRMLLALWLQQQGVPGLDAELLERLSARLAIGTAAGSSDLPAGWRLSWRGEQLTLQPPAAGH
jgi:tRNA(Ile)-lysidine synthase